MDPTQLAIICLYRSLTLVARDALGPNAPPEAIAAHAKALIERGTDNLGTHSSMYPEEKELFRLMDLDVARLRAGGSIRGETH